MAELRFSAQAEVDIVEIYQFAVETFGSFQAEAYAEGLKRTCGLIADFPGIGTRADELMQGLRRFRFQSHHVYDTFADDVVVVRAIFHVRRSLRSELFE